jgi:hypothetical protein
VIALIQEGRRGTLVTLVADGREGGARFLVLEEGTVIGESTSMPGAAGVDVTQWANVGRPALVTLGEGVGSRRFSRAGEVRAGAAAFGAGHISTFGRRWPAWLVSGYVWLMIAGNLQIPDDFTADQLMVCSVAGPSTGSP